MARVPILPQARPNRRQRGLLPPVGCTIVADERSTSRAKPNPRTRALGHPPHRRASKVSGPAPDKPKYGSVATDVSTSRRDARVDDQLRGLGRAILFRAGRGDSGSSFQAGAGTDSLKGARTVLLANGRGFVHCSISGRPPVRPRRLSTTFASRAPRGISCDAPKPKPARR